jgi:uncharacterized Zn-binding protein involved in type VI secretion
MTRQAQELIRRAKSVGLKHGPDGDFIVFTPVHRTTQNGIACREYGDALLCWRVWKDKRLIVEASEALESMGCKVIWTIFDEPVYEPLVSL